MPSYRKYTLHNNSKEERAFKYQLAKYCGFPYKRCIEVRDYSMKRITRLINAQRVFSPNFPPLV